MLARPQGMGPRLRSVLVTVLESLLRGVRSHEGTITRVRLGPGERYAVDAAAPVVLCGTVEGALHVDGALLVDGAAQAAGATAPPGGVVVVRPGPAVVLRAGASGATVVVCGYRPRDGGARLAAALPPVAVVEPDAPDCVALLRLLAREAGRGGSAVVRDRLLDLLLACTLDCWAASRGPGRPGWSVALVDPVVGPALAAMHADPARRWTVAELAALGGAGRAAFAKRFRELVGSAPLAYLRSWRMAMAAEHLADPDVTIEAVARRVGYSDAFSFSAAFKRERGVAPSTVRA